MKRVRCFLGGGDGMLTTAHDCLRFAQVHIYTITCMYRIYIYRWIDTAR